MSPPVALRAAVAADFRASGAGRRLALVGVVVWLAYEWGIGNETVTPLLLARVIAGQDGAAAVSVAAIVGFAFTFLQQLVAGLTALTGFSIFDRTAAAAWSRLRERLGREPARWSDLGLGARLALVFGLGTTAVALLEVVASGSVGVGRHRRAIVEAAFLCGVAVGVLGGAAGALAWVGREVDGLAGATEAALRLLGNPLLWLGLLVAGVVLQRLRRRPADAVPAGRAAPAPADDHPGP